MTTFIPTVFPVDAGKNIDVAFLRLSMVCSGWKLAQHAAFVSPVEYSCMASASERPRSMASWVLRLSNIWRTSLSVNIDKAIAADVLCDMRVI